MKQRPILFSAPMVNAILEGRKTQTRRIIKDQPQIDPATGDWLWINTDEMSRVRPLADFADIKAAHCPYGKVGDQIWVRETWAKHPDFDHPYYFGDEYVYRATDPDWNTLDNWKWKPSIFMPRDACRIMLQITGVRVERLTEISEKDAIKEGASDALTKDDLLLFSELNPTIPRPFAPYQFGFMNIWLRINGVESWNANPFVWVITFKRIQ